MWVESYTSMLVSELQLDRREIKAPVGTGLLPVAYAPTKISTDTMAELEDIDKLGTVARFGAIVRLSVDLITDWELAESKPAQEPNEAEEDYQARLNAWEESGPHIVPITEKRLRKLPIGLLAAVLKAIFQDIKPMGETNARRLKKTSRAR